ncbi:hypothetical protein U4960_07375 [Altererythrobacter sp. H2]|uniref:hypothetical protein n=1 Tax=Altererythrobacter sp. H2 TaxID=3108391 RepID=UPI002B4C13B9|nr:hypothetical protein [Altererythrobacter sp. H2]WRK97127.1 hypothetical protein U4960_07375 [Altererythrobacter sp. H2]
MFVDTTPPCPARSARRTDADRLREALVALAGGHGVVLAHEERAWASVTFAGARHRVTLEFAGDAAVAGGENLIAELPEHEFTLPRQLVADATVCAVEHVLLPKPNLRVECELLLVEDT